MKKENLILPTMFLGLLTIIAGGVRGCNQAWNSYEITQESHQTYSYPTGITGHVEYSIFNDDSQEIKTYPSFGHRLFDSRLYQDLDGDNKIDRIRENGSEIKMNSLDKLLTRQFDYQTNQDLFDKGDLLLIELQKKYNLN